MDAQLVSAVSGGVLASLTTLFGAWLWVRRMLRQDAQGGQRHRAEKDAQTVLRHALDDAERHADRIEQKLRAELAGESKRREIEMADERARCDSKIADRDREIAHLHQTIAGLSDRVAKLSRRYATVLAILQKAAPDPLLRAKLAAMAPTDIHAPPQPSTDEVLARIEAEYAATFTGEVHLGGIDAKTQPIETWAQARTKRAA